MSNEKVLKSQLLIESSEFAAKVKLSKALKESVKLSQGKAGTLIVRNVPCTILNRRNQNGRIYPTAVMEKALKEARVAIETKQLLSKPNEHPDGSFIAPSEASHVIIDAYIKKNVNLVVEGKKERQDVLFMDWEVLNTQNGKDLRALLEAECSIGTSIRGVGDLVGDTVDNYQLLGVDIVGNPSSSTYTRMPIAESVKVELSNEKSLKEGFTVSSSSTDVAKDIESAGLLANKLDKADFATISNTSTKLEHDIDPKTGAQTTLVTFEADTSDEVTDLNQALAMAQRILTNPYSHVDSVTIENIDEEDETTSKKEAVEEAMDTFDSIKGQQVWSLDGRNMMNPSMEQLWKIADELRKAGDKKDTMEWQRSYASLIDYKAPKNIIDFASGKELIDTEELNVNEEYIPESEEVEMESIMTEAKEEDDSKAGRKFVLKCPAGFVGMDGNALVFKEDPKEAIHFIVGKEESGLVHLSGVEKILDAMGVYDIEKYYRKDIPATTETTTQPLNDEEIAQEATMGEQVMTEDNGYDTKYIAHVTISKENGMNSNEVMPISATELPSVLSEVSNQWKQKMQSGEGQVSIIVEDTTTGDKLMYNSESNQLEPYAGEVTESTLTEEDSSVTQDGNKLTVKIDDEGNELTKEFEDPAQASVVAAGLEKEKIPGDIMMNEADGILSGWYVANDKIGITGPFESREEAEEEFRDFLDDVTIEYLEAEPEEDREHNDIESGWYAGADNIGVAGPFASREDAEEEFKDFLDKVSIEYLSSSDEEEESEEDDGLNERLYSEPSEPSDDLIDEPIEEGIWTGLQNAGRQAGKGLHNWWVKGFTPEKIINAAAKDNLPFIKSAIKNGVDLSKMKDASGMTPLIAAVDNGNNEIVDLLAKKSTPLVNVADSKGKTPLVHAIKAQNVPMIQTLLDYGSALNTYDKNVNILQYANQFKNKDAYNALVDYFEENNINPLNVQSANEIMQARGDALMNRYQNGGIENQFNNGYGLNQQYQYMQQPQQQMYYPNVNNQSYTKQQNTQGYNTNSQSTNTSQSNSASSADRLAIIMDLCQKLSDLNQFNYEDFTKNNLVLKDQELLNSVKEKFGQPDKSNENQNSSAEQINQPEVEQPSVQPTDQQATQTAEPKVETPAEQPQQQTQAEPVVTQPVEQPAAEQPVEQPAVELNAETQQAAQPAAYQPDSEVKQKSRGKQKQ